MMRKGIFHLKLLLERGKLASEAIYELYRDTLSCRSEKVDMSVIFPGHYEFSCSNSPAYPSFYHISKPRKHSNKHCLHLKYDHRRMEETLYNDVIGASPLTGLPEFGHSPMVRQLRVTDSPFSVRDMGEDDQVDRDAEEFIKRVHKDLESQRLSSWF